MPVRDDALRAPLNDASPIRWRGGRTDAGLLELARLAYASAASGDDFRGFLEIYRQAMGGAVVSMVDWERSSRRSRAVFSVGPSATEAAQGYAYYARLNPLMRRGTVYMRAGVIAPSQAKMPLAEYALTEYFNDFASKLDIEIGIGACLLEEDGHCTQLACLRPARLGLYGAEEERFLQPLIPHLRRAMQLRQRLGRLRLDHTTDAGALDRLREALLVVNASARPVLINNSARRILAAGDGLTLATDGLRAAILRETKALRALIAGAAENAAGTSLNRGGLMRVSRPSLRQALSVLVAPVAPVLGYPRLPAGCVTVVVRDPEETNESGDLVARQFGLTPAEARLADLILRGQTLESSSDTLRIGRETARTHLKSILKKTGARRQSEFLRRVTAGAMGQLDRAVWTDAAQRSSRRTNRSG